MLSRLDSLLLSQFQRFSRSVQIWTGKDCLDQAKLCRTGEMACVITMAARAISWPVFSMDMIWLTGLFLMLNDPLDEFIRSQAAQGMRNMRQLFPAYIRLMPVGGIGMSIWLSRSNPYPMPMYNQAFIIFWVFLSGNSYLQACDPLPPCSSKFIDNIRALLDKQILVGVEN